MIINHILIKKGKRKEKKKQDPSRLASKCSDIVLPPTKENKNKGILRMTRKIRITRRYQKPISLALFNLSSSWESWGIKLW